MGYDSTPSERHVASLATLTVLSAAPRASAQTAASAWWRGTRTATSGRTAFAAAGWRSRRERGSIWSVRSCFTDERGDRSV